MGLPLLRGVPAEDARELLQIARRRTFARGDVVFHENDPADSVHVVVAGRFASRRTSPLGDVVLLAIHGPGDVFGELALLSDASRVATVAALERGETRSILRDDFLRLRATHPTVNEVLLALLAERLRETDTRLLEAHFVPAETRVRRRLCALVPIYRDGGERTVIPLTQEELAHLAGTSRATVNRVLREEEGHGAVELHRGRTAVIDADAIARRARR